MQRRQVLATTVGIVAAYSGCLRLAEDNDDGTITPGAPRDNGSTGTGQSGSNPTEDGTESNRQRTAPEPSDLRTSWPQFQVNAANTGHHPDTTGPRKFPAAHWTYATSDQITVTTNPIVAEGRLVIGSNDQNVHAVNIQDGSVGWTIPTGAEVWGTPAFHNGTVLIGSGGNADRTPLTAIDLESGQQVWQRDLNANQLSPTVYNGRAFFAAGTLYAVDIPSGTIVWEQEIEGKTSPAVADGVVYVGSGGARPTDEGFPYVFAFAAADGTRLWRTTLDAKVTKRCVQTVADDTVLVGGHDGTLFALDASDGGDKWRFNVGEGILSSPAVADGRVYVGSGHWEAPGQHVYALDIGDGTKRWEFDAGSPVYSSPAIADGIVYVGDSDGSLMALNGDDGAVQWRVQLEAPVNSAPVVLEDVVYVATADGVIHALTPE